MKGNAKRFSKPFTLCWDCAHATDDQCAWVKDGEAVEGWTATPTRLKWGGDYSKSYIVRACPMFKRDAENGGQRKYVSHLGYMPLKGEKEHGTGNHSKYRTPDAWDRMVKPRGSERVGAGSGSVVNRPNGGTRCALDHIERDILDLSFGIVERAVLDWQALDYGRRESVMIDGLLVERLETCEFFFGDFFLRICDALSYTPQQIRRALCIPEDALEILKDIERSKGGNAV